MTKNEALRYLLRVSPLTLRAIAREINISHPQLSRWKSDVNTIRSDNLEKVARAVGKKLVWKSDNDVEIEDLKVEWQQPRLMPKEEGYIPVVGMAEAGPGVFSEDDHPVGYADIFVSRPHGLKDQNAFGVLVTGDSMEPAFKHNQIVLVAPGLQCSTGDRAVVGLKGGERLIAELNYNGDRVELIKYNSDNMNPKSDDIEFSYKIVWVKE